MNCHGPGTAPVAHCDRLNVAVMCHSLQKGTNAAFVEAVVRKKTPDRSERAFLEKRLRQETQAALGASDARAAAAHVCLANHYLKQLNGRRIGERH